VELVPAKQPREEEPVRLKVKDRSYNRNCCRDLFVPLTPVAQSCVILDLLCEYEQEEHVDTKVDGHSERD